MVAGKARADTIAYWRFDDVGDADIELWGPVLAGNPLPDSDGSTVWRKAVHDHSGNGNHLTTWEYAWAGFNWSSDVPSATVPATGASNTLSMVHTQAMGCCPAAMTWSEQSLPSGTDIEAISPAEFTIEGSFKLDTIGWSHTIVGRDSAGTVTGDPALAALYFQVLDGRATIQFTDVSGYFHGAQANFRLETNRWYNMAAVSDGSTLSLYLDAELVVQVSLTASGSPNTALTVGSGSGGDWEAGTWSVGRGLWNSGHVDRVFGYIDEVRISDTALAPSQFLFPPVHARNPVPRNDSLHTETEVLLQWEAGCFAASHDVYIGDNFADVNDATTSTVAIYKGRQSEDYYPATGSMPVELGKVYYWRVDEVNDLHPAKLWRGQVWTFTVQPLTAYDPSPPDGARYVDRDADLAWSAGFQALSHAVYFGTDQDSLPLLSGAQVATTYDPGPLNYDTTYYWRIDESNGTSTYTGDVWSFTTLPDIPITDPSLLGWWKLDEGVGTIAVDWSGHSNHGTIYGAQWAAGYDGQALQFDGEDDYVDLPIGSVIASLTNCTCATWVDFSNAGGAWQRIFDFGSDTTFYMFLTPRLGTTGEMRFAITIGGGGDPEQMVTAPSTLPSGWHHVAVTIDAGIDTIDLYLDGVVVASNTAATLTPSDLGNTTNNWLGRSQWVADAYFNGSLDDFRIYDYALSQVEIAKVMRGDPLLAWDPRPANGSTPDVEAATPLSWSPGDKASEHDVYFGTDQGAVETADTSDTTGIYRSRVGTSSYTPPEVLRWGQTYYWRIDEFNTDATISQGRVWSFTVADFLIVDNFEDYNDFTNRIYLMWIDGYGSPSQGIPGNGTGSTVGHLTRPYAETVIVHEDLQAMPMDFNNVKLPYRSEAVRTFDTPQDWTRKDVKSLTVWFRGLPASFGSFSYDPVTGIYTMTARGTDIWDVPDYPGAIVGNYHDEFHYAHKRLSGNGSIVARVLSVANTDAWAKAAVMIRETLDANSVHAMVVVSPTSGVALQGRTITGGASFGTTVDAIAAPRWVRLTRSANTFTGEHSANGSSWDTIATQEIPMAPNVYIGLALTSNNVNATCVAEFSDVTTAGTGDWQSQDIGITSNIAEQLYVRLEDSSGNSEVAEHPDPDAVLADTWQEWNIDLHDFADAGVNTGSIKKMYIGVGDEDAPKAGGTGSLYVDDIRLYRPRCIPSFLKPPGDSSDNCVVDYFDLEIMAGDWLVADQIIATADPGAANLVGHWKLDDGFGTAADDSSVNSNNGVIHGDLQWVAGYDGGAVRFDGYNDYVELPIGSVINSLTNSTFAMWVDFSNAGGAWQRIFDFGSDTTAYMFLTPRMGTADAMRFAITVEGGGAPEQMATATSTLPSGWHHVAVTINADGDTFTLYLDGAVVAQNTEATLSPSDLGVTTNNWLGRSQYALDAFYRGVIDDFRIYSRALTQAEIGYLADKTPGDGQVYIPVPSPAELYEAEPQGSRAVNFMDFAVLADTWLDELLWPLP